MAVFDRPLQSLQREDVQRLLDEGESEPLLWEAKGTRLDKHNIRKNVCAFANGNEAGYLILGAEEADGWKLSGWDFPEDPSTWVASVVNDGVRPVPSSM